MVRMWIDSIENNQNSSRELHLIRMWNSSNETFNMPSKGWIFHYLPTYLLFMIHEGTSVYDKAKKTHSKMAEPPKNGARMFVFLTKVDLSFDLCGPSLMWSFWIIVHILLQMVHTFIFRQNLEMKISLFKQIDAFIIFQTLDTSI